MLIVWVCLTVLCTAVVLVGRLNRSPDRLQSMGFGTCDGVPCFLGVNIGTHWAEALHRIPNLVDDKNFEGDRRFVAEIEQGGRFQKSSMFIELAMAELLR
jgi:hypothetical protein